MNDRHIREQIITFLLNNPNEGYLVKEISSALGINESDAKSNLAYLERENYVYAIHDILGNDMFSANTSSSAYLATPDGASLVQNINVSGNAFIASGDINIFDTVIGDAINNAGIPDGLKDELKALLIEISEESIAPKQKGEAAIGFLKKAGDKFGNLVASVAASLIIKALTGAL